MVYYLSVAAWQTVMKFNSLKLWTILFFSGFPGGREVKKICLPMKDTQETQFQWLGWEDPLERKRQPTPVFLSGKSHGQRSLGRYSLCRNKELNSTERILFKFLASLHGLQHLSSLTRKWIQPSAMNMQSLHHRTAQDFPKITNFQSQVSVGQNSGRGSPEA